MKNLLRLTSLVCVIVAFLAVAVFGQTATGFSTTASTVGSTVLTLQGSVPAGNTITYQIAGSGCGGCTAPTNGTISQFNTNNGTLIYTPTSGYVGSDSFTFTVTATPTGGGSPTVSSAATVTITVTNAKTTISGIIADNGGNPRQGTVTFFLVQQATSGDAIVPGSSSVSSVLNGAGRYTVQVYPSRNLSPQAYYNVRFKDKTTGKEEPLGVYDIPAATTTLDLASCNCKVTDANLAARYTFLSAAAYNFGLAPSQKVTVSNNGSVVGSQPEINFIASSPLAQTIVNNTGSNRVDVTFSCPTCGMGGGGGGSGTVGPGTVNKYALFSGTTTVGDALLSQAGNILSLPGHLDITQQTNSTSPLTVRASGSPTVPLARFLDSGNTERFAVGPDASLQFSGFTSLPTGAAANQAKLVYFTGVGAFSQQLLLSRNGSSSYGPVVRVAPTSLPSANTVPLWTAVGDIGSSILSQTDIGTISVAGKVEASALGFKASSNAGYTRLRATNTFDAVSGLYNIQMAVLEAELGLTNGLLINTQESGAPIIMGVFGQERGRFTSTGLTVTSNAANTSGLKFANLTSASPAGSSTSYLGLDSSGNVVIAATPAGGGGGGAPTNAEYLVFNLNGTLTNERRLIHTNGLAEVDGGINNDFTISLDTAYAPTWTALHTHNPGTSPTNAILLDINALGSPGTRNSHNFVQRARARDGSGSYSLDWQTNIEAYDQGGANRWRLQSRRGASAFGNRLVVEENGDTRIYGIVSAGSANIYLTDTTGNLQLTAFAGGARTGTGTKIVTGLGTYTTGNCLTIDANGNAIDSGAACPVGGGGTAAWNGITNPSANQALTMAAYSTTWTYNNATSTTNLFKLTDTASNTGTGVLATFATGSASTLKPFSVEPRGLRSLYADHLGNVVAGLASRSTTDTDGFLYVPAVNGLNVNSPTGHSSFVPLYVDTAAGVIRAFYSSNWNALGSGSNNFTSALTITLNSGTIFAAGRQGVTNPAFSIVSSGGSDATGVSVTAAAAASGATITATSSGTNEALILKSKAAASITLNTNSTDRWSINSSGHFLAATDNTYDIGAVGATRPRDVVAGRDLWTGAGRFLTVLSTGGGLAAGQINSPANGVLTLSNYSGTDFDRLQFGAATSSFPALKRSTTTLQVRLADDSAFAGVQSLYIRFGSGSPEGAVTAPVGAIYSRTDGGANTTLYIKESGSGNTGWVAK